MATSLICFVHLCFVLALTSPSDTNPVNVREAVIETAIGEIGVREVGSNRGEDVEKYLASAGFGGGYAWCAAFVNWVYIQHDIPTPNSAAWSPSWFPQSRVSDDIVRGDVFGVYFRSKGRIAHVGLIEENHGEFVYTIEGNTNEAGSREGDGVYRKRRVKRQIYRTANWID